MLRKVAAQPLPDWLAQLRPDDTTAALALDTAHPRWVAQAFADALKGDLAQTKAALVADDLRPEVHLVARRMSRDELVTDSGGVAGPVVACSRPARGRRQPR